MLNKEHSPDIMLLAARSLTFMADAMPSACAAIVRHGAVQAFCARLLTIEYIDLAEQSLQVPAILLALPDRPRSGAMLGRPMTWSRIRLLTIKYNDLAEQSFQVRYHTHTGVVSDPGVTLG